MSSTKAVTTGRKKDAIHFVNARPASETERIKIQRLVRAHVGKWISDQTKDRSSGADSPESSQPPSTPDPSSHSPPLPPPPPGIGHHLLTPPHCSPSPASLTPPALPLTALSRNSPGTPARHSFSISPPPHEHGLSDHLPATEGWAGESHIHFDPDEMELSPATSWQLQQQNLEGSLWDQSETTSRTTSPESLSPPDRSSATPPEYIESFGCTAVDPFHMNPMDMARTEVAATEEYCLYVLWPGLTPVSPGQETRPASCNWLPLALQDRTLFTAFVFGSLSHKRVRWVNGWISRDSFQPEEQRILQYCEMETIKNVTREVSNPNRAVCDAVILSVVCMAHNVAEDNGRGLHLTSPFDPPLPRLQWLDIYGALPPNLVHIKGLVQMVRLRGGLQNLTLPGLAATLSFSDVVTCSTFLMPPVFPFMPLHRDRLGLSLQKMLGFTPVDIERRYAPLRDIGLTSDLVEVLYAMHIYTKVVEEHLKAHLVNPDYSLIADQRNLTHHTLLSLPAASQLDGFAAYQPQEIIYEACRIAALVFGVGVVFPLPAQSTPLAQLAKLIQNVLQISDLASTWNHPQARIALFWVLMMGGIAADDQPERSWFVHVLSQAAASHGIGSWSDARKLLGLMVWYDRACDRAGSDLWTEVKQSLIKMEELSPS
ncbi:uncharacterized protein BO80DRAFT_484653 [Aspergillus ibericus CBS 121593]|uniref:Uncharacterized protein n=1 Tax=Aspergillus ibericus CBS 121593 TaxID=1448316 RepID=A0A395HBI7_9EURO|nr:hypothetical protein BO80DRAFT_484653 [Aspergillus ibericus CBS 121593]RAL04298.1 hypothetical protein BO80DRAFT_484653 [Aspergillus ibericus CBS 121593]